MIDPKDQELGDEEVLNDEIEEGDAGLDDNEGGDETEAGQEPEDVEAQEGQVEAQPQSRGERRFQKLTAETRAARAESAALREEVAKLAAERQAREQQAAQPKEESPEQEQARLAMMTVEERVDYRLNKAERRHQFEMNVTRFHAADMADRSAYATKAAEDPRRKRMEKEVDALLAQERRAGRDFPRDTIYYFLLGQKVDQGGPARDKAKKAGAARIQSQRATADSGRSDRAATRRSDGSGNSIRDLEKRLEGQFI